MQVYIGKINMTILEKIRKKMHKSFLQLNTYFIATVKPVDQARYLKMRTPECVIWTLSNGPKVSLNM